MVKYFGHRKYVFTFLHFPAKIAWFKAILSFRFHNLFPWFLHFKMVVRVLNIYKMVASCFQHSDSQTEHTCTATKISGLFSQDCTSQFILVMEDKSLKSASSLSLFAFFFIKELFHLNIQDRHQVTRTIKR